MASPVPIDPLMKGDFKPLYYPYADPNAYGFVSLTPTGEFPARSNQTFRLTYTVGPYGIDEGGSISVSMATVNDAGELQFEDPKAANYVSIHSDSKEGVKFMPLPGKSPKRPWNSTFSLLVYGAYLNQGEHIYITIGDTSKGSPGWSLPTYCDAHYTFMVGADVCATGEYYPLNTSPTISVIGGDANEWKAVLPSRRQTGDTFKLGIKAEDFFGNPTKKFSKQSLNPSSSQDKLKKDESSYNSATFTLKAHPKDVTINGLPDSVTLYEDKSAHTVQGLSVSQPCTFCICMYDDEGSVVATSNYMCITEQEAKKESSFTAEENSENVQSNSNLTAVSVPTNSYPPNIVRTFWGDLHGQSGESIGTNTIVEYFNFSKDLAFLDVTGHQANDFQVTDTFWKHLNAVTASMNKDNEFIVFPGYEWSGNTPVGGDHNVFYLKEGEEIYRSSHAILADQKDIATDATTVKDLFKKLKGKEVIVYSHVGGRPADVSYAHDPTVCTSVEVHSDWGTFEWILWDSIELGHRVGVVCNSDGHKAQPGASYPGAAEFGAYGGLTCFMCNTLTRESIYDCIKKRHHYGTTGCRMDMDVWGHFGQSTSSGAHTWYYEKDPNHFEAFPREITKCMMGDIVETTQSSVDVEFHIQSHSNIERVEVFNGKQNIYTYKPFTPQEAQNRLRVTWEGAECRGRARRTKWDGSVNFHNVNISKMLPINAYNKELKFEMNKAEQEGHYDISFDSTTTGNWSGFDIWYTHTNSSEDATFDLNTYQKQATFSFKDISYQDTVIPCGDLHKKIKCFLLPTQYTATSAHYHVSVPITQDGKDNPIYIKVTTEDGFNAWSTPMYVFSKQN